MNKGLLCNIRYVESFYAGADSSVCVGDSGSQEEFPVIYPISGYDRHQFVRKHKTMRSYQRSGIGACPVLTE